MDGTRINKYLSEIGHCSRREADKLIEQGRVIVNGKPAQTGGKVRPSDKIVIDGNSISQDQEEAIYIAYHKPIGVVSTTDSSEKENIIKYVNYPKRIFPIGRLDKESEGLIFLTSDGDIVNKILRARNNHEKEYEVIVNRTITPDFIEKMSKGVPILGEVTRKCEVEQIGKKSFRIVLTQGLNRQIRRMCEYFNYEAVSLKRTRIMNVKLDLPVGDWRDLTNEEIAQIQTMVAKSAKTQKKSSTKPSSPKAKTKKPGKKPFFAKGKTDNKRKNTNPGKRTVKPSKSNRNSKGRRR